MKKILSLVLTLALVVSVLSTVAFAAGSKSTLIEVVSASKSDVIESINVKTTESEVEPATDAEVDAAVAATIEAADDAKENVDVELLKTASAANMTLIAMADFTADEYPCVLNFYGEGTEDIPVVVLVKYENAEDWTVIYAGLAGEFSAEVEANGTYAIYMVG